MWVSSSWAAASIASVGAGFRWRMPAARTRATGERESSPNARASSQLPAAASISSCSVSLEWRRRHQNSPRSMTTASEVIEQQRRGIMTGPPLMRRAIIVDTSTSFTSVCRSRARR